MAYAKNQIEIVSKNITAALSTNKSLHGTLSLSGMSISGTLSSLGIRGYSAYEIAVKNGFTGTEREWLDSLNGKQIVLRNNNNIIEWKYIGDEEWIPLLDALGSAICPKPTIYDFPTIGSENSLYITDKHELYRWSDSDLKYYKISNEYEQIDGGTAF